MDSTIREVRRGTHAVLREARAFFNHRELVSVLQQWCIPSGGLPTPMWKRSVRTCRLTSAGEGR